jgi:hypothetical protein
MIHMTRCVPVYQVWGRELPNTDESTLEQGRGMVADGSFTVCASDVYGLPREVDILQQQAYSL